MRREIKRRIEELDELKDIIRIRRQSRIDAIDRVRRYIAAREASDYQPKDFVDKENGIELSLTDLIEIVGRD